MAGSTRTAGNGVCAKKPRTGCTSWPIRYALENTHRPLFAFALFLDWANASGRQGFHTLVKDRSLEFYGGDVNCPLDYEPGGQDFLSPCLAEADLMRRVMEPSE